MKLVELLPMKGSPFNFKACKVSVFIWTKFIPYAGQVMGSQHLLLLDNCVMM